MRKLIMLAIAVLTGITSSAHSSGQYLFRLLDTDSGLPDNQVRNMTMLPNGLMCIQTSSMLSLYDGSSCQSYAWNPIEIPYTEYSALTAIYYDEMENVLWCTSRDNIWIFNLNTRTFEYDIMPRLEPFCVADPDIAGFFMDGSGDFWIVTHGNELIICDRSGCSSRRIPMLEDMQLPVIMRQDGDRIWMLSINGTLAEYDTAVDSFRSVVKDIAGASMAGFSRMEMDITANGGLWIMFDRHLVYYDPQTGRFTRPEGPVLGARDLYTSIALDAEDNLWIGTARSGVSVADNSTMQIETLSYLEQTDGNRIYHHTDISKIYADDRDGVWIATLSEGLLYWSRDIIHLHTINAASLKSGSMPDESVKCMVEDTDGTILVGTIRGLYRYDPEADRMSLPFESLRDELCISLYRDSRNRIWLGTFYNGAYCIDGDRIRHYSWPGKTTVDISYLSSTPNYNCVRSFHEDAEGNFWISVYGGIGRFDERTGDISLLRDRHKELERFMIVRDICDHKDGMLLVSGDNGRFLYSPSEDRVYTDSTSTRCHRQSNQAIVDSRNLLWIAEADGLSVTDLNNGKVYAIDNVGGLKHGTVMGVEADNLGNVWATTFSHISRIKPIKNTDGDYSFAISSYGSDDGVYVGAFFQKSVLKHSSGNIYFGGAHGIASVIPDRMYQSNFDAAPVISSFSVAGRKIEVGEEFNGRVLLPAELDKMEKIELKYNESFVTFGFSNLNYANPAHTTYRYRLENFDKDWTTLHSQDAGRATYTYLEPGDYTFMVIAADNDTDWSEKPAQIHFTVRPPWYRSTVAYMLYAMLLVGVVAFAAWYAMMKARRNLRDRREREALLQKEELDQMKFRFFTNISHELRTPLTLILLPLESIMRDFKDSGIMPQLETMYRNASQLLSLVNHLLDFRKLEMGGGKNPPAERGYLRVRGKYRTVIQGCGAGTGNQCGNRE